MENDCEVKPRVPFVGPSGLTVLKSGPSGRGCEVKLRVPFVGPSGLTVLKSGPSGIGCEVKPRVPFVGPSGLTVLKSGPSGIGRAMGMQVETKIEELKMESPLQLEKTIDGMEVKEESELEPEETTERMEVEEDLEDIFSAMRDAQSELKRIEKKWHAKETALRDEVNSVRANLLDKRKELKDTRFALQDCATKLDSVERERAAAIIASANERRKLTFMREDAHQKMKTTLQAFDAIVTTVLVQHRNLEAEVKVWKRAAKIQRILKNMELKKQHSELDALRTLTQEEKQRHDAELATVVMENRRAEEQLQILKHRLDLIQQGRDAALLELDEQKDKVEEECNAKLRISKLLTASQCKRRRLEYDLIVAGEEVAEEKMTMLEAHRTEMEKARFDYQNLEVKLLEVGEELLHSRDKCKELEISRKRVQENLLEAESKEAKLEEELLHSRDNFKELDTTRKIVQENLEEEKEKTLCQICFESPKDSVAFPCLHFNYCFSCLELHRTRNQSCPTCRTTIVAVLKCVVCV